MGSFFGIFNQFSAFSNTFSSIALGIAAISRSMLVLNWERVRGLSMYTFDLNIPTNALNQANAVASHNHHFSTQNLPYSTRRDLSCGSILLVTCILYGNKFKLSWIIRRRLVLGNTRESNWKCRKPSPLSRHSKRRSPEPNYIRNVADMYFLGPKQMPNAKKKSICFYLNFYFRNEWVTQ